MSTNVPFPDDSLRSADELLYEIVNGERQELAPMGAFENVLAFRLGRWLDNFAEPRRLGAATVETLFVLRDQPLLQRRPDVAFVSRAKQKQHRLRRTSAWDVVPDLAVEVVSFSNLAEEIDEKLGDYFAAGVQQVWVVYPETRRLYVYQSLQNIRGHSEDDTVDASPVLPGFTFRLGDLFDSIENIDDDTP